MSSVKVVVTCVAGTVSGGPEALHQLVDMINQIEPGAGAICYSPYEGIHKTFPQYQKYNIPIILKKDIPSDAIVIFPEIITDHSLQFQNRLGLWWLSVDNFPIDHAKYIENFSYHFTQSQYAKDYLDNMSIKSQMLTDYINDSFLDFNINYKKNQICVNPAKGAHLIEEFKQENLDFSIVELTGITRERVKELLSESKIYIDFGHHPGKDRFPREASLSNCVVLTTMYGSALNDVDIPISSWYKFNDTNELTDKVKDIQDNYETHFSQQIKYKNSILEQKNIFRNEVKKLLELF